MRKKLINLTLIFIFLISIVNLIALKENKIENNRLDKGRQLIYINEIRNEIRNEIEELNLNNKDLIDSIDNLEKDINNTSINNKKEFIVYQWGINLVFIFIIFGYTYFRIVRPFEKMERFAEEVGRGNLNISINYEKNNLFGAFTWAFDHMRKEILKARSCEKEAIDNNKTVIATLSHDIKTPVASIRAYAEGLEANLDYNVERRKKYINVIMKKCDEVTKLTNDLFLHSLSDLDRLKMNIEEVEISKVIKEALEDLINEDEKLSIIGSIPEAIVSIDVKRFNQVIENIINNSLKYAEGSKIEVSALVLEEKYIVKIKDYGKGIMDKDLPFIFDKFYRGKNSMDKQGSGLGLFIVKYVMDQLKGDVQIINNNGLEVSLILPLKISS